MIVLSQSIVPVLEYPLGIVIVNVTVLAVSVVTGSKLIGVNESIVPTWAVPTKIEPLDDICCPLKFATSQVNSGFAAGCVNVAEHSIVAAAFEYPAGAVRSKYNVTLRSLPVVFAGYDEIDAPPEVDFTAVMSANVFGFVIVPSCAIDPPLKLAASQSNVTVGFDTVTLIDCVAVHVFVPLSYAET